MPKGGSLQGQTAVFYEGKVGKRMHRLSLLGVVLLVSLPFCTAAAAAAGMNDFAYGVRLATPPGAGLVKVALPQSLHRDLAHADGADIRVFAMDGQMVPHLLQGAASAGGRPSELFFERQAGKSYILAYGRRRAQAPAPPPDFVQKVALRGAGVPTAGLGPRIVLGGPARLEAPRGAGTGRMMSLSTFLLGSVLVLAFLVWWVVRRRLRY